VFFARARRSQAIRILLNVEFNIVLNSRR